MAAKALVVDDSKLARFVLKQMLQEQGVFAVTAESAEVALDFLSSDYSSAPDIIFMDHNMPGRDGLQAVSEIKSVEALASIPIYMYTSKEGASYKLEAQNAGAEGVFSKKIKPHELASLLRRHDIAVSAQVMTLKQIDKRNIPSIQSKPTIRPTSTTAASPFSTETQGAIDSTDSYSAQLTPSLNSSSAPTQEKTVEQIAALAGAVEVSGLKYQNRSNSSISPMIKMLDHRFEQLQSSMVDQVESLVEANPNLRPVSPSFRLPWWAVILMMVLVAWGAYQAGVSTRLINAMAEFSSSKNSALSQTVASIPSELDSSTQPSTTTLELLEWGFNRAGQVEFGDNHLSDALAGSLAYFIERLAVDGFKGIVRLHMHVGNFCLATLSDGQVGLAAPDSSVTECVFTSMGENINFRDPASFTESIGFGNFMAQYRDVFGGRITIETRPGGMVKEKFRYPAVTEGISANRWNDIATRNNRVEVELVPID